MITFQPFFSTYCTHYVMIEEEEQRKKADRERTEERRQDETEGNYDDDI